MKCVYVKCVYVYCVVYCVSVCTVPHKSFQRREQRLQDQLSNPHYLKPSSKSSTPARVDESTGLASKVDVSNIPVSKLELGVALVLGGCIGTLVHV